MPDNLDKKLALAWSEYDRPLNKSDIEKDRTDVQQARLVTAMAMNMHYDDFHHAVTAPSAKVAKPMTHLTMTSLLRAEHQLEKPPALELTVRKLSALTFNKCFLGPKGAATPLEYLSVGQRARMPTHGNGNIYDKPAERNDYQLRPGVSRSLPFQEAIGIKVTPDALPDNPARPRRRRSIRSNQNMTQLFTPGQDAPGLKLNTATQNRTTMLMAAGGQLNSPRTPRTSASRASGQMPNIDLGGANGTSGDGMVDLTGEPTTPQLQRRANGGNRRDPAKRVIIEQVEGLDEKMRAKQQAKENKPRNIRAILQKMRESNHPKFVNVANSSNLPQANDTAFEKSKRRQERQDKKEEQDKIRKEREVAQEERLAEKRRKKIEKKRRRSNRGAGAGDVDSDSEDDEADEARSMQPDNQNIADTSQQGNGASPVQSGYDSRKKQRLDDDGAGPSSVSGGGYPGQPYRQDQYGDWRQGWRPDQNNGPPPDYGRPQHGYYPHQHQPPPYGYPPYHPPGPPYQGDRPPPPGYVPYPPPSGPQYPYIPGGPGFFPQDQRRDSISRFQPPRRPPGPAQKEEQPRLPDRDYHTRKQELYGVIGNSMADLSRGDARDIEEFLDNQEFMFGPDQTIRDYLLRRGPEVDVMIRLYLADRSWKIVNVPSGNRQ